MKPLTLTLFGEVKLTRGVDGAIRLPRRTRMLLAYLAADSGKPVAREKLASLIWPDRSEDQARHSLRQCLFTLNKAIGGVDASVITADRHHISLRPELLEIDTWRFETSVAEGTPAAISRAAVLYTGEFAAGLDFEHEDLDTWCASERTRFRELCYETLATLTALHADTAKLDEAIEIARRLVVLDPLREEGHRTLMRLFDRAGRRAEAHRQYQHCREVLRAELNVDPEAATLRLYSDIRGRNNEVETNSEIPSHPAEEAADVKESEASASPVTISRMRLILVAGLFLIILLAAAMLGLSVGQSR